MRPKALSGSIAKYSRGLVLSALAIIGASQAPGATYYWDGGTVNIAGNGDGVSAGGTGNWSAAISNWDQGSGLAETAWPGTTNAAVFGGTAGTVTLTTNISANSLTFNTDGYILTGAQTLTLVGTTPTITANSLVSGLTTIGTANGFVLAGTNGLNVAGNGRFIIGGTNTSLFTITGNITVTGFLGVDNSGVSDRIPTSNSLTLNGGQLYNYSVNNNRSQTWSGLTFSGGSSVTSYASGGNTFTVAFGAITRASAGSILFQRLGNNSTAVATHTTTTINTNGILGPWALYNQATTGGSFNIFVPDNSWRYAVGSTNGTAATITGLSSGANFSSVGTAVNSITNNTINYDFSGAVAVTTNLTGNTARYTGTSNTNLTIPNGMTLTLEGLLNGGTSTGGTTNIPTSSVLTIASTGTGALAIGSTTNELVVTAGANNIAISAPITGGNSSGGLTIMGYNSSSLVTLSGANTYSGKTTINAGTLVINASGGVIPDTSDVTIASSNIGLRPIDGNPSVGVLNLNGFSETIGGLNGTGRVTTNTTAGTSTLTVGASNVASATFSGVIQNNGSGLVALTKTGTGTQTLSGANTYSGATTIANGTLALANNLALQNSALDTTGSGVVTFAVTTPTIGGLNGSVNLATKFTTGYSSVTALTLNPVSGVTATYSGVIADGGTGMTLTKSGLGTQTLSGANTYTGITTVAAGTLNIQNSNALGTTANTITVAASAKLQLQGGFTAASKPLTLISSAISFASGGTVTNSGGYEIRTFTTSSATGLVVTGTVTAEVLVVAGGGGGGGNGSMGGGGGAGGLLYNSAYTFASGNNAVTVGAGGSGSSSTAIATDGGDSNIGTLTAIRGGHGGSYAGGTAAGNAGDGGSGGGAAWSTATRGTGTAGQGNAGGTASAAANNYGNGGGGGAGAVGGNGTSLVGGAGGIGLQYSQFVGVVPSTAGGAQDGWFAGGGGGSGRNNSNGNGGAGGTGGGGKGGDTVAIAGLAGTGGGGGGADTSQTGAAGGSGVVIVRFVPVTTIPISLENFSGNNTLPGAITLTGTLAGSLVGISSLQDTLTLSGAIGESGGSIGINKLGAGTVALSGTNTYSGATSILQGTLQLGSGLAAGSLSTSSAISVASGATFAVNRSDTVTQGAEFSSSAITGAGNFAQTGAGTTTLNVANSYTGTTTISAGTLSINTIANVSGGSSAIGAPTTAPTGLIAMGSATATGTLLYTGAVQSTDRTIQIGTNSTTPANTDTGGATIQADGASNAALTFSAANFNTQTNAATGVGANRTLTLTGASTGLNTISGIIQNNLVSGSGTGTATVGLTKTGAGTWVLGGTAANTYTGLTTVTLGTLALNKTAGVNAIAGPASAVKNDPANILVNGGTLFWNADNQIGNNTRLDISSGLVDFNGKAETLWDLRVTGGTVKYSGPITITDPVWAGGVNEITDSSIFGELNVSAGTNTIFEGASLTVGPSATNLTFSGTSTTPNITVNSSTGTAGVLKLAGDVTVDSTVTSASITSGLVLNNLGQLDLNGATRNFTVNNTGAGLAVSAQVIGAGGEGLTKSGTGKLTLAAVNNSYTGTTTVNANGGTLEVQGTLSGTTGVTVNTSGTLLLNSSSSNIVGNGTAAPNAGAKTVAGTVSTTTYTGGSGSTLAVGGAQTGVTNTFNTLTLSGNSTLDFGGGTNNTFLFNTLALSGTLNINNWVSAGTPIDYQSQFSNTST
jgi:autotransporter-associated beta strand protein